MEQIDQLNRLDPSTFYFIVDTPKKKHEKTFENYTTQAHSV